MEEIVLTGSSGDSGRIMRHLYNELNSCCEYILNADFHKCEPISDLVINYYYLMFQIPKKFDRTKLKVEELNTRYTFILKNVLDSILPLNSPFFKILPFAYKYILKTINNTN